MEIVPPYTPLCKFSLGCRVQAVLGLPKEELRKRIAAIGSMMVEQPEK